MGEIPEDIMKAADEAFVKAILKLDDSNGNSTAIIAQAILAERQRCADVVMLMKGGVYVDRDAARKAILNP